MNGNSGRGPRRARVPALMIAMTGVALLAAACGGGSSSSSSTAAGSSQYAKGLAYARCMRSHGMPSFPDPDGQGQFPPVRVGPDGVTQQSLQSAKDACRHLQPGGQGTAQQRQGAQTQALNFSKCMRAHGVPNFPDPSTSNGGLGYNLSGVDTHSPQYQSAQQACQSLNSRGGQASAGGQS